MSFRCLALAAAVAVFAIAPALAQTNGPADATANISPQEPTPNLHPPDAPALPYHFAVGPAAPLGEHFGNVASVAFTPAGHLIVLNRNPVIMMVEYDEAGHFLRVFDPNIAVNAHGMRIDRHGNIWLTDSFLNLVWKLNSRGEPLMMLGMRGEVAAWDEARWNGMFNQPLDVAFDPDDNLYVVQGHGGTSPPSDCTYCATYRTAHASVLQGSDARILKFDANGHFLTSRSMKHDDPLYPTIHTVIVTPKGEVWVGDRQANKILVFDRDLKPLRQIQEPNHTSGLTVDARGKIWLSTGMDGMIMQLSDEGKILGWTGKAGLSSDPRSNLIGEGHYLAVSPDQKTIYVADTLNAHVHRIEMNP